MAKHKKAKASKSSSKHSGAGKPEMLDLVAVMAKLVERLEALEKKMDQVVNQTAVRPQEPAHAAQPSQRPDHGQANGRRERIVYKAICADCCKNCEVPFKPVEGRPVYCKECFAIRKAGHTPKDPTANVVVPQHLREVKAAPTGESKMAVAPKNKKAKKAKKAKKKK